MLGEEVVQGLAGLLSAIVQQDEMTIDHFCFNITKTIYRCTVLHPMPNLPSRVFHILNVNVISYIKCKSMYHAVIC